MIVTVMHMMSLDAPRVNLTQLPVFWLTACERLDIDLSLKHSLF